MSTRLTSIAGRRRAVAFTAAGAILSLAVAHATLTVSETGSTLILPLFKSWVAAYNKVDPNLQMTVGATGSAAGGLKIILIFSGFMLFNFMTNLGPNAQTYLLAGEVFPTAIRGKGAGFAAAFAKIGAVATAFLFPILLVTLGTRLLLYGLVIASLLGAVVTWAYRIETTGVNLDRIGETEATSESGSSSKAVA
jgi:hypothetical protein